MFNLNNGSCKETAKCFQTKVWVVKQLESFYLHNWSCKASAKEVWTICELKHKGFDHSELVICSGQSFFFYMDTHSSTMRTMYDMNSEFQVKINSLWPSDPTAIMPCARFHSDHFIINLGKRRMKFPLNFIKMEKSLVKRAPELQKSRSTSME